MNYPPSNYHKQKTPEASPRKKFTHDDLCGQIQEYETTKEKLEKESEYDEWDNFGDNILFI